MLRLATELRCAFVYAYLDRTAEAGQHAARRDKTFLRAQHQVREISPLLPAAVDAADLRLYASGLDGCGRTAEEYARLCLSRQFSEVERLLPQVEQFARRAEEILDRLKVRKLARKRARLRTSQTRAYPLWRQRSLVGSAMSLAVLATVALLLPVVRGMTRTPASAIEGLMSWAVQVTSSPG